MNMTFTELVKKVLEERVYPEIFNAMKIDIDIKNRVSLDQLQEDLQAIHDRLMFNMFRRVPYVNREEVIIEDDEDEDDQSTDEGQKTTISWLVNLISEEYRITAHT